MFNRFHLLKWVVAFVLSLTLSDIAYAAPNVIKVEQKKDIKIVYDINQNDIEAGIGKALYYARGLLEAYKDQNVPMDQLHISLVIHGAAGYWLLKDEAYQNATGNPFDVNPNTKVVQELLDHGVSVELCHVTMKAHHWDASEILPGVKIVFDAYTRIVDLEMKGYAYIKFV
ncbi:DsrE family protein [Thiomicrorhabdus sp. ZW0627]|uniref:DsrE family protein n=1 Tax=Thiomicrorhabdus sp. ZW0627 TaxID=3039774 RepID=UPI00243632BD|nr:DsrE family protein [Thiomicrorhabdus sp. ZW0627]MDG6773874.1 DsrE family protein [Thiomicrorhabdus sp. ZW0627]